MFRFREDVQREDHSFFSNLYEAYRQRYEWYKSMVENADFHPVQEFRNLVSETAQQAAKTAQSAEESAMKSAQNVYETIVQPGSQMDKQLSAFSQATSVQFAEAWNSVKGMKERIETATFLSEQRMSLVQQLRGNRAMLSRMREMSYAVNSKQMATLMRKITECYDALERSEVRAKSAFLTATGRLTDIALFKQHEPKRYAKYSSDPLFGIATYPLGFHLLVLGASEIPLRVLLRRRGFERRCVGPVTYYYHRGRESKSLYTNDSEVYGLPPRDKSKKTPLVFVHGIGIGLIVYLPVIDALLESGRPVLLPEIPYVSGFRPWQSSNSVLSPAVVASTVSAAFSKLSPSSHDLDIVTHTLSFFPDYCPDADDSDPCVPWIFKGDLHWTFLWNFVVELRLQIRTRSRRRSFVFGPNLFLPTSPEVDNQLRLPSPRSRQHRLYRQIRYHDQLDDTTCFPMDMDFPFLGPDPCSLHCFLGRQGCSSTSRKG